MKSIVGAGLGLVALLATVVVLGLMGSSALNGLNSPATSTPAGNGNVTTTVSSGTGAALAAACRSDAQTVATAVETYDITFSNDPLTTESEIQVGRPLTYGHGIQARRLLSSGLLPSWPSAAAYSISLSTRRAGVVEIYVPARSRHPVSLALESSRNGCNTFVR